MTHIAIYTRLSEDKTGQQTATHRQEEACRKFAELREWSVVEVFEDVDYSAYAKGVVRPAYEAMLQALRQGVLDGVVVWKLDRLVRRPAEFERFWSLCEDKHAFLASAVEPIDSSTDLGVALVRILVAFASLESATISSRVRAKQREMAESGRAHAAATGFGHKTGLKEIEPQQARAIRFMADEVIRGTTFSELSRRLQQRRFKNPSGGLPWSSHTLRQLLKTSRLVGDRAYRGEVVARDCFAPILDRRTFDLLQERLRAMERSTPRPSPPHLLDGLLFCGRCGAAVKGRIRRETTGKDSFAYRCQSWDECRGVSIQAARTDAWITEAALTRMARRKPGALGQTYTRDAWSQMNFEERQKALPGELVRATIGRLTKPGPNFDPTRIVVVWRWPDPDDAGRVTAPKLKGELKPTRKRIRYGQLSVNEAALELGNVSRSTVLKLIHDGELRAEFVASSYWLKRSEVDRFLRRNRVPTSTGRR